MTHLSPDDAERGRSDGSAIPVRVALGRAWITAGDLAALEAGHTVELPWPAGQGVELRAGPSVLGWGELVVVATPSGQQLGVRLREIAAD